MNPIDLSGLSDHIDSVIAQYHEAEVAPGREHERARAIATLEGIRGIVQSLCMRGPDDPNGDWPVFDPHLSQR